MQAYKVQIRCSASCHYGPYVWAVNNRDELAALLRRKIAVLPTDIEVIDVSIERVGPIENRGAVSHA